MILVHLVRPKFDLRLEESYHPNLRYEFFTKTNQKVTRNQISTINPNFYLWLESLPMIKRLKGFTAKVFERCFQTLESIQKPLTFSLLIP
jgi:hypothetical protein